MPIAASLLPEFDNEMKITRTLIERVPDSLAAWKPHEKSMTMGKLAIHLPGLVDMVQPILTQSEFDLAEAGKHELAWESNAQALAQFDRAVASSRALIAAASDDQLNAMWTFKVGGHTVMSLPRVAALRGFVMNHVIHHRGQLSVYLRLNDIALPEIYGPNADSVR